MLIKQVGSIKHDEWWWVERKSYQGQKQELITTAINNIATFMTKNKILSQFFFKWQEKAQFVSYEIKFV